MSVREPLPPDVGQSIGGVSLGCCVEPSSAIWMIIIMLALTLFLVIFFCVTGVTCRWIYKRRMRKKCEALRNKYIQDEKQKRSDEMKAKRLALRPILPYHSRNDNKDVLSKAAAFQRSNYQQPFQMQPMVIPMQPMYAPAPRQPTVPPPFSAPVIPTVKTKTDPEEKNKKKDEPKKKQKSKKMPSEKKKVEQRREEETKAKESTETTPGKDSKGQLKDGTSSAKGVSAWSSSTLASKKSDDNPVKWPSTTSSTPARPLRPPNVYELKTGRKITIDDDVPSPARGSVAPPARVPTGFSHLRAVAIKRDCMPSLSDPTMPRRS